MTKVCISWSELAGASERVNLSPWSGRWKTPACKTKGINKQANKHTHHGQMMALALMEAWIVPESLDQGLANCGPRIEPAYVCMAGSFCIFKIVVKFFLIVVIFT